MPTMVVGIRRGEQIPGGVHGCPAGNVRKCPGEVIPDVWNDGHDEVWQGGGEDRPGT